MKLHNYELNLHNSHILAIKERYTCARFLVSMHGKSTLTMNEK